MLFNESPKKIILGHFCIFGLVIGHFGLLGPKNGAPSSQTDTYRKTEGIESYLWIWGRYHSIESGPSEPKKGVTCVYRKKMQIFGQKMGLGGRPKACHAMQLIQKSCLSGVLS